MKREFNNFWRDYWDLCKQSGKRCKKHWKGYIVLCVIVFIIEFGYFFQDQLKEKITAMTKKIKSKKNQKEAQA